MCRECEADSSLEKSRTFKRAEAEVGDRYLGSVFRYFGTTKSEILIPNTELLNDYANYRNTGTES